MFPTRIQAILNNEPYKYCNILGRVSSRRVHNELYEDDDFFMLISEDMLIPSDETPEQLIHALNRFAKKHPTWDTLNFAGIPKKQADQISEWSPIVWDEPCYLYVYSGEAFEAETHYNEYALDHLRPSDVPLVFEHYTYPMDGVAYIEKIVSNATTFCARYRGEAVSWVVQREDASMGIMYTLEAHRKRGLGHWLSKHLVNAILEKNEIPYLHIKVENGPSIRLAEQLGFQRIGEISWRGVKNPYYTGERNSALSEVKHDQE